MERGSMPLLILEPWGAIVEWIGKENSAADRRGPEEWARRYSLVCRSRLKAPIKSELLLCEPFLIPQPALITLMPRKRERQAPGAWMRNFLRRFQFWAVPSEPRLP